MDGNVGVKQQPVTFQTDSIVSSSLFFYIWLLDSLSTVGSIPFEKELSHTKFYLELEQIRFEYALQVEYDISCTDFTIPTLTLQPLVENAVRHGVRGNEDGRGTVIISTREYPDRLRLLSYAGRGYVSGQCLPGRIHGAVQLGGDHKGEPAFWENIKGYLPKSIYQYLLKETIGKTNTSGGFLISERKQCKNKKRAAILRRF